MIHGNGPCLGARCALWSDDARACVLAPDSIHLLVRTAVTDAAVDIMTHYKEVPHG